MVTFAQLRDAKPNLWQQAADDWLAASRHAADCANEIRAKGKGALDRHWQDKVGQRAGHALAGLADKFECAAEETRGATMVLDALAESIGLAQSALRGVMELARAHGLSIGEDGVLQPLPGAAVLPIDVLTVAPALEDALRAATQADEKAAAALRRIQGATGLTDPVKAVQGDQEAASRAQLDMLAGDLPVGLEPSAVAAWWRSLTPQQQRQLELAEPTLVAGLDGVPDAVRNALRGDGKYDRVKLVQYALDHWNDHGIDKFDNNCTMFVSKALQAAGVQQKNDGWGTLGSGNWVEGAQTGWKWFDHHDYSHSSSWTQAAKLHAFLTSHGSHEVQLSQVQPGDVIFFDQDSPNPHIARGHIHHAAVVTAVTPDGDIKYTQHTGNAQNLSLSGRELRESTQEGQQRVIAVRVAPNWY